MANRKTSRKALFKFDGPVGVVEELLPTAVTLVTKVNVDKRVALRFLGLYH